MLGVAVLGSRAVAARCSSVARARATSPRRSRAIGVAFLPAAGAYLALAARRRVRTAGPRSRGPVVRAVDRLAHTTSTANDPRSPRACFVGRGRRRRAARQCQRSSPAPAAPLTDRPRLQWLAWGVIVAVAIAVVVASSTRSSTGPSRCSRSASARRCSFPCRSRSARPSRRRAHRPAARAHDRVAGLAALVGGVVPRSSCSGSAARRRRRADAARALDARGRASPRCSGSRYASGSPTSRRGACTASGTRPTRCCARSAAGSRARSRSTSCCSSWPSRCKKTMSLDVAEVWTRGRRPARARGVGARSRAGDARRSASEEETVVARAGVSGPAWARVWMPRDPRGADDEVLRVAPITNSGELLGMIVVRRPDGRDSVRRGRRPGAHRARPPGRARARTT